MDEGLTPPPPSGRSRGIRLAKKNYRDERAATAGGVFVRSIGTVLRLQRDAWSKVE